MADLGFDVSFLTDEYLNTEVLLDQALHMVFRSILFRFHSQRMVDLLLKQARSVRFSAGAHTGTETMLIRTVLCVTLTRSAMLRRASITS